MLSVDYGRDHNYPHGIGFVGYPDRVLIIFGTELSKTGQKEKWKNTLEPYRVLCRALAI